MHSPIQVDDDVIHKLDKLGFAGPLTWEAMLTVSKHATWTFYRLDNASWTIHFTIIISQNCFSYWLFPLKLHKRFCKHSTKNIFFYTQNICCGYSKEPSQWDGSFEHPKHMLKRYFFYSFTLKKFVYLNLWFKRENSWFTSKTATAVPCWTIHIYYFERKQSSLHNSINHTRFLDCFLICTATCQSLILYGVDDSPTLNVGLVALWF